MADKNKGVYSPGDCFIIINGRTMEGRGEETFLEVERTKPEEFSTQTGANGEYTFVENLDKSGKVKYHCKQNAAADQQFLSALLESKALFPIRVVRQRDFLEQVTATNCMIGIRPRKNFSQKEETRVWEIAVGELIETDK